ncbi:MAG TPA: hypothetical protein VJG67_02050 [Candidatus Paceibacterota bacterium]
MKSIRELMAGPAVSNYTGSTNTFDLVAREIERRYGEDEVEKYDPYTNTLTFAKWASLGYCVKRNQRAIRSITFVEKKDKDGNVTKRYKRTVCLFYYLQVEKKKV